MIMLRSIKHLVIVTVMISLFQNVHAASTFSTRSHSRTQHHIPNMNEASDSLLIPSSITSTSTTPIPGIDPILDVTTAALTTTTTDDSSPELDSITNPGLVPDTTSTSTSTASIPSIQAIQLMTILPTSTIQTTPIDPVVEATSDPSLPDPNSTNTPAEGDPIDTDTTIPTLIPTTSTTTSRVGPGGQQHTKTTKAQTTTTTTSKPPKTQQQKTSGTGASTQTHGKGQGQGQGQAQLPAFISWVTVPHTSSSQIPVSTAVKVHTTPHGEVFSGAHGPVVRRGTIGGLGRLVKIGIVAVVAGAVLRSITRVTEKEE
ncbi:hypothetical protein HDU76_000282 [Blyttiomyces sp. JEL0837]|nr:hypothetical protein HDU76_000282 [Blyttiomyces sp. JEL0837]